MTKPGGGDTLSSLWTFWTPSLRDGENPPDACINDSTAVFPHRGHDNYMQTLKGIGGVGILSSE